MNHQPTSTHTLTRATHDALLVHLTHERDWLQSARGIIVTARSMPAPVR